MGIAALAIPIAAAIALIAVRRPIPAQRLAAAGSGLALFASVAAIFVGFGDLDLDRAGRVALPLIAGGAFAGILVGGGGRGLAATLLILQASLIGCCLLPAPVPFGACLGAAAIAILFLIGRWGSADDRVRQAVLAGLLLALAAAGIAFSSILHPYALGVVLAIPAAIFPFHRWIIDPVGTSSPAVSVPIATSVLAGGGLAWLRYGSSLLDAPGAARILVLIGAGQFLYAALCAMAQIDLRRLIAYAAASHAGLALAALATNTPAGADAALDAPVLRGLWLGLALLAVGWLFLRIGHLELDRLGGLGIQIPRFALIAIPAFVSAMGMPGTCSYPALAASLGPGYVPLAARILIGIGIAATIAYTVRALAGLFLGRPGDVFRRIADLTRREAWVYGLLAGLVILAGIAACVAGRAPSP